MLSEPIMTDEEKRWRAESDARSLAEAKVIMDDPERVKAARTAAADLVQRRQERLKEDQKEVDKLKSIAKNPRISLNVRRGNSDPLAFPTQVSSLNARRGR